MIGEIHGSNEMPAEFLRLVCGALQRGQPVLVGLEMFDPNAALAAYMASTGVPGELRPGHGGAPARRTHGPSGSNHLYLYRQRA
jgi:hypothetical protein